LSGRTGVNESSVAVGPELEPHVRLIWGLEVDQAAAFGAPERILPDGVVEAVFHYATPLAMRFGGEDFGALPRSCLVSLTRRWVEIRPSAPTGFPGWRARETYRRSSADEVLETFELAEPGREFALYSETRLTRQR
jgi:hypothetical protein